MNLKCVISVSCFALLIFANGIAETEGAIQPSPLNISSLLPLLESPLIASLNVSQLLKTFPAISAQNVSQLINTYVPQGSRLGIQTILGFVPQIASQNLTQLLQYFPQLAAQNISELATTIPQLMSNTTELMQIVQQVAGTIQKYSNQNGSKHDALSSLQGAMNVQQLLTNALQQFKITEASLYTIGGYLNASNVSPTCTEQFIGTLVGLNWTAPWAMEMLDAIGKPPSYLRSFSFLWVGDYQECKDVKATIYNGKQFEGQYCMVGVPAPASIVTALVPEAAGQSPSIRIGTCMPGGCSNDDVRGILTTVSGLISGKSQAYGGKVDCKSDDRTLKGGSIVVVCILSMLGFVIAIGTLYDVITVQIPAGRKKPSSGRISNGKFSFSNDNFTPDTESNGHISNGNGHTPKSNGHVQDKEAIVMTAIDVVPEPNDDGHKAGYDIVKQPKMPAERGTIERILLAFSAYSNGVKLLNTYQPKGAIGSINGIRFLSISWVILGHTTLFLNAGPDVENLYPYMFKKVNQWTFYAYYSATVSVDSFFTLSGLLVAYLTLKQLQKSQGAKKMNWFMFYFHRFWRLTPPYMLVLMVVTGLWQKMGTGPLWPGEDWVQTKFCQKNWWANLLYVNNYVKTDEICMGWSWYLSNDMMFYVLSPLILVPLYYNVFAGGAVAGAFFLVTTIATGVIAKQHEYTALFYAIIGPKPKDGDFMKNLYFPAHTRMGPYIIGLLAGYILFKYTDKIKERMHKLVVLVGWLLCFTFIALVIYGVYPDDGNHFLTVDQSVAYVCLHRSAWAIALSWIIIACHTGYGGWINEVLSFKAFVPLGRLTYCAYLVHPIVINVYYMATERLIYFTDNEIAWLFMGNVTMSFGVAFLTSLAFESPMMGLEKVIFKKEKNS